ncbi:MAG: hypothetical protein GXO22_00040 [Aquificae bacterium]|nr:hypothetical protein [Aquificota bacterium]
MRIFVFFLIVITAFVRLFFLLRSIKNEKSIRKLGGVEYAKELSNLLIVFHVIFYLFAYYEALNEYYSFDFWVGIGIVVYTFSVVVLFFLSRELGVYWSMRLFKVPNMPSSDYGLFKKVKYPMYVLGTIPELIGISLMFKAEKTFAILFPLYMVLLGIRIFIEENLIKGKNVGNKRDEKG